MSYDARLMCTVTRLDYDFEKRTGSLTMDPNHCCDMNGCISLFQAIDPNVEHIQTFAGTVPDTAYTIGIGGWIAE